MSDASNVANSLRERFGGTTEERLGKALSELLENPLLTGALGRVFEARDKASQAQEVAMGALNIPSAADIERLTRRLRSVSYRLEGIEDGLGRLDRALAPSGVEGRLSAIEEQLQSLARKIDTSSASGGPRRAADGSAERPAAAAGSAPAARAKPKRAAKGGAGRRPAGRRPKPAGGAKARPKNA